MPTRRLLARAWIDEKRCQRGLNALAAYRRDWDETAKVFKAKPLHDWSIARGGCAQDVRDGLRGRQRARRQGARLQAPEAPRRRDLDERVTPRRRVRFVQNGRPTPWSKRPRIYLLARLWQVAINVTRIS